MENILKICKKYKLKLKIMGTRATISIELENKSILTVFLSQDGYPTNNHNIGCGITLINHYNNFELASKLLSHGNIYSLQEKIDKDPTKPHTVSLEERQKDVCFFFNRDYKQENVEPIIFFSEKDYKKRNEMQDWNYLFKNGEWFVLLTKYDTNIQKYKNKFVKVKDFIQNSETFIG